MSKKTGNIVNVYVTPKSGRDCICGLEPDQNGLPLLKVKVTAAPEKGRATASVLKLLSKSIGCAKSNLEVVRGETSRYKQISVNCSEDKFLNWMKSI